MNLDTRINVQQSHIEVSGTPCTHDRTQDWHPCRPGETQGEVDYFTAGRVGAFGAFDSVNWGIYNFDDRDRYSGSIKLSVLAVEDPLGGTHDFKFGVEGNQFVNNRTVGYSGNTLYVDLNRAFDPETFINWYYLEVSQAIIRRSTGSTWDIFLQDSYKPISNLTIKYGVRFDRTVLRNDIGDPVIRGSLFAPRFFAAWDPFSDQKTKIGGGWGRFNDSGRQSLADFTSLGNFGAKYYFGELIGPEGAASHNTNMVDVSPRRNLTRPGTTCGCRPSTSSSSSCTVRLSPTWCSRPTSRPASPGISTSRTRRTSSTTRTALPSSARAAMC